MPPPHPPCRGPAAPTTSPLDPCGICPPGWPSEAQGLVGSGVRLQNPSPPPGVQGAVQLNVCERGRSLPTDRLKGVR
ncbi:unnamed protein product [Arctogadus glacialis]